MAVIMEEPNAVAVRQLDLLNIAFPDAIKYSVLGVSVLLLLVAICVFLWQVFRCCTQTNASPDTNGNYPRTYTTPNYLIGRRPLNEAAAQRSRGQNHVSAVKGDSIMELEDPIEVKVFGSLRFTVFYEPLHSLLVVTVLQAEGLQRRSQAHRPHPFVRLRLMWVEQEEMKSLVKNKKSEGEPLCAVLQEWHTRTVRDSCSPLFGEQFSCGRLSQQDLPRVKLRMEVKDFDNFSRHMVLGEVRLSLRHLDMSYPLEIQEPLQTPQKDPVGEVLVSLKFLPAAQRLEVGLLKIRTLQTYTSSDTALYARISVRCNQCRLRQQKTIAVRQCPVTVFNEVLMFSVPESPPKECSVAISVYETDTNRRRKHLVGQVTVGKDRRSEDNHWTLMMRSVRQPIAVWHQMLI